MMQNKPCSHTGFWVAISLLSVAVLIGFIVNFGLLIGLASAAGGNVAEDAGEDEYPVFTEIWSYGTGTVKAVRIPVEGVIFRESESRVFAQRFDKVEGTLRQIRAASQDDEVRALIVEVNSPGGDLTSSDEIYDALRRFKTADPSRKIIAFTRDISASGGYYVSMTADWIIAEPTALVGSIGVIMQTLNWKGLSEKIGVTDTTIKSGANKDMLNPFRDVSPEQIALLQEVVDSFYSRFFSIVKAARGLEDEQLKPIADGRIVTADVALTHRLIDQVGYWEEAVAKTAELLGEKSLMIVRYEHHPTFSELLASLRAPSLDFGAMARGEPPRLMYLWKP